MLGPAGARTHPFNSRVERLEPSGSQWRLRCADGSGGDYSLVVVCNGLQHTPRYPSYPGRFDGEVLHTCDYKSPEQLRGKRVLVIGAGNSGCDLAVEAVHHADAGAAQHPGGSYYQPSSRGKRRRHGMGCSSFRHKRTPCSILQVFKAGGLRRRRITPSAPDYPLDAAHPIMNSHCCTTSPRRHPPSAPSNRSPHGFLPLRQHRGGDCSCTPPLRPPCPPRPRSGVEVRIPDLFLHPRLAPLHLC